MEKALVSINNSFSCHLHQQLHTMHSTNDTNNNAGKFRIENGEIGGQQVSAHIFYELMI